MSDTDLRELELLFDVPERTVFKEYVDTVGNEGLLKYKREKYIQYGNKAGEPLYIHVLNGIFVLETLRTLLGLSDTEARVLFTAFTIHDINKVLGELRFLDAASPENLQREIENLGLDTFFPEYATYVEDISLLVHGHSARMHHKGEGLIAKRDPVYGLGAERAGALVELMQAADQIELSKTLDERKQKEQFLSHLNTFVDRTQYEFVSHRLTEHRGLLTNVLHNAIVEEMEDRFDVTALLFYPDGVAYLVERGTELSLSHEHVTGIAERAAGTIAKMTAKKLNDFVASKPGGVSVDEKCLELGLPFHKILKVMAGVAQTRNRDPDAFEQKARDRAERDFDDNAERFPEMAAEVAQRLESDERIVTRNETKLYHGELARTYYIFLKDHFNLDDPWRPVCELFELPEERWAFYEFFHARWDRAYVLANDISLTEEDILQRLAEDGQARFDKMAGDNPNVATLTEYLQRHVEFSFARTTRAEFAGHLEQYVANQHKQCVHCSAVFETDRWMTADVRDGITVQAFSNRLRGGPGDPKKYVCTICKMQFLLEKLNYPNVVGEKLVYLHLFPYSFLTAPFIQSLRTAVDTVLDQDLTVRALLPYTERAFRAGDVITVTFTARTSSDRPQNYGLYVPHYSKTVGNLLIFPYNPAGTNDSQRFLNALWNAMLLQRHFGCKVLLSDSPIAPLDKESFGDLFVDNVALSCRGFVTQNDYRYYEGGRDEEGALKDLWRQAEHLFAIKQAVFTTSTRRDEILSLVQTMADSPLKLFYTAEKLMEARVRGDSTAGNTDWLTVRIAQRIFPHIEALALAQGGSTMSKLSDHLKTLAGIAWSNGLRGRTLAKNSLMTPLDEVFKKLNHRSEVADLETLRAAAADDIFEYLTRITEAQYRPGQTKWDACKNFVDTFFDEVYQGVYRGKRQKLLADEKLLRSAFLFYIREEIPRKKSDAEADAA